jgi:hypothetical protein
MNAPTIIYLSILALIWVLFGFFVYQRKRINAVFDIRTKWIFTRQFSRLGKYSWHYMYEANKHNWYGLKYPREKYYP